MTDEHKIKELNTIYCGDAIDILKKLPDNSIDLIYLDPFMGSGTTLAVAKRLNRKFVGIDISRTACMVAKRRIGTDLKIIGAETTNEVQKMNPHDVAKLIIETRWGGYANPKKSGDMGIDGWVENGTIPVQVKRSKGKVGRTVIENFKVAIERDHKRKGKIVARDFTSGSYEEAERIKKEDNIWIELDKFDDIFETHNRSENHHHGRPKVTHPAFMIL